MSLLKNLNAKLGLYRFDHSLPHVSHVHQIHNFDDWFDPLTLNPFSIWSLDVVKEMPLFVLHQFEHSTLFEKAYILACFLHGLDTRPKPIKEVQLSRLILKLPRCYRSPHAVYPASSLPPYFFISLNSYITENEHNINKVTWTKFICHNWEIKCGNKM